MPTAKMYFGNNVKEYVRIVEEIEEDWTDDEDRDYFAKVNREIFEIK